MQQTRNKQPKKKGPHLIAGKLTQENDVIVCLIQRAPNK